MVISMKFCVYKTIYSGNELPKFYIGSTSVSRINAGYRGSVRSKRWRHLWEKELAANPHLFSTIIISLHDTRKEALEEEFKIQKHLDVVNSNDFINMAYACPSGVFGHSLKGVNHPNFGKTRSIETRKKISENHHDVSGAKNPMFGKPGPRGFLGKKHSQEAKEKMRAAQWDRSGANNPMFGKPHPDKGAKRTEETKQKMKGPKPIIFCPVCGKSGGKPAMIRFHFAKCKLAR